MPFNQQLVSIKSCLSAVALPRLETQLLLSHVLKRPREWLIAHDDQVLTGEQCAQVSTLCQRRLVGEPMAYLLGQREFMGLLFAVTPAVLIPRPDTELLVQTAMNALEGRQSPRLLDLGTGSGAIAVSVAKARPDVEVWATDICNQALDLAKQNARTHEVRIKCSLGDWYEALPDDVMPFEVIVSNPPYIHPSDQHLAQGDLRFEPRAALTEGVDGLSVYRTLAAQAHRHLVPGGWLCVEHGYDQQHDVGSILDQAGLQKIETLFDLAGYPRVTVGSYNM